MRKNASIELTTRGRYAVTAMVELAGNDGKNPLPLSHIAETGDISLSYLEQLFSALRRHGLVRSYRGPGGGYILAKPTKEIFIAQIMMAAEDSTPAKRKSLSGLKANNDNEHTRQLWSHVGECMFNYLNKLSLQDVLEGELDKHKDGQHCAAA
jgi:Rrf2 family iron-sulfur cluster assembly transcriptional regulator